MDKAHLLKLTAPEMTAVVGGLRVLLDNKVGQFTDSPGVLNNKWFVNLLDMEVAWKPSETNWDQYDGVSRKDGSKVWTGSQVDLLFGSNSQLRAQAEF